MSQLHYHISRQIAKYIQGSLEADEMLDLEQWMAESASNKELFERLLSETEFENYLASKQSGDLDVAYDILKQKIERKEGKQLKHHKLTIGRIAAYAASIIMPLAIGLFLWINVAEDDDRQAQSTLIEAGESKAQLFLASGDTLILDKMVSDTLQKDNTTLIAEKGTITYRENPKLVIPKLNRIVVPRGGEFHVTLADGTKVWLNAETELTYPVAFTGEIRKVKVKGEAYFDVKEDKDHPFVVEVDKHLVKVLGTEFNVRNYFGETEAATTLVEGSVQLISALNQFKTFNLNPGEQALVNEGQQKVMHTSVDTKEFVSWKEGLYYFKHQPLEEVMNELARWYDLEIVYDTEAVKKISFTGRLKRSNTFNYFVGMVEQIEVAKFKINGNSIIISEY